MNLFNQKQIIVFFYIIGTKHGGPAEAFRRGMNLQTAYF